MEQSSAALKTGIEPTGRTWGADEWHTLWLNGRRVGSIVGMGRAARQLRGIARTQGVALGSAVAAYKDAVATERAANKQAACPWMDAIETTQEPWELQG